MVADRVSTRSFYSFYTHYNGKASDYLFKLFWNHKYEKIASNFKEALAFYGSVENMGMNDALIYLNCMARIFPDQEIVLNFPDPPTKDDVLLFHEYECSLEKNALQTFAESRKLLTAPKKLNKSFLACKYGIDNGCKTAIETGTCLGATSYIFSGVFEDVHTIEADPELHKISTVILNALRKNVSTYRGDSGEILVNILAEQEEPCLIFLDAHWSKGPTTKNYGECPLLAELKAIFDSKVKHVVVIDDMRLMDERESYPGFREIFDLIPVGRKVVIQYDQMIISS